jgi:hypothetical protein
VASSIDQPFRSMLVQRPETAATKAAKANLVRCHGRFPHENLDDFLVTHGRFNMNQENPRRWKINVFCRDVLMDFMLIHANFNQPNWGY